MDDPKQQGKPWYKKWWVILLFLIVGAAIIGNYKGGVVG